MDEAALKDGKARVQEHLIGPLEEQGMQRPQRVTVDAHEAFLDRLRAKLAYLDAGMLAALAETVAFHAEGKRKDRWPAEVSILNWAARLCPPPASDSRMVRSYLASAAGRRAQEEGYLVELYLYLKKFRQPPGDYALSMIRREAEDRRRELAPVAERARRGAAGEVERERLERFRALEARCRKLVAGEVSA